MITMLRLVFNVLAILASLVTAASAQHWDRNYYDDYGRPYATTQPPSYREIIPNENVTGGMGLYEAPPAPRRCFTQYFPPIGGIGGSSSTTCY